MFAPSKLEPFRFELLRPFPSCHSRGRRALVAGETLQRAGKIVGGGPTVFVTGSSDERSRLLSHQPPPDGPHTRSIKRPIGAANVIAQVLQVEKLATHRNPI